MKGIPTIHWFIIDSIILKVASDTQVGSAVALHLEIVSLNPQIKIGSHFTVEVYFLANHWA